jgi:hypothetical protein
MNEGDLMGLTYEQVWQNYGHLNDSYESVNGESQQQAAARRT